MGFDAGRCFFSVAAPVAGVEAAEPPRYLPVVSGLPSVADDAPAFVVDGAPGMYLLPPVKGSEAAAGAAISLSSAPTFCSMNVAI
mmetsp:Transcript_3896/g.11650  ORF Transcript_3896/g.11650 Transcript_3896/m.11650 type:complete len:85 (-) Transcript_3896:1442-1696(-)